MESSTSAGRPIGSEYSDPARKIAFMDTHGIDVSVLSLANPWLEFLQGVDAANMATALNEDLQAQCEASGGRFYGFGVLPFNDPDAACAELERIAKLDKVSRLTRRDRDTHAHNHTRARTHTHTIQLRGVIVSARGLDAPSQLPVYQTASALGQV